MSKRIANRPIRGALGFLVLMCCLPLRAQTGPSYTAEFLGEALNVSAMNQSGECVGSTTAEGNLRGWIASSGAGLTLLPLPPGRLSSRANDINGSGVIVGAVGSAYTPEFGGRAAAWLPEGCGRGGDRRTVRSG